MNLWLERGAPAEKLIVGFPAYGQAYLLDDANRHYYGAPATGKPTPGKYTASSGTLAFYEVRQALPEGATPPLAPLVAQFHSNFTQILFNFAQILLKFRLHSTRILLNFVQIPLKFCSNCVQILLLFF